MAELKKSQFSRIEEEVLKIWRQEKTFELSLKQREGQPYFSFYDGPPFANGLPHYGHVVPSTIKDAMGRYKTMRGFYVPRKAGWDTHGLPVEYEVEKQLGLSGKKQILELGVDKFNQACRDSVFRYKNEFEAFIRRLGRWIDLENAYATLDDNYIESVWWVLSELHKKGLIYRGFRSMPYCPRCATPLSNFELNQGYQDDVEDPSVFAVFPLTQQSAAKLGFDEQKSHGLDAAQKNSEERSDSYAAVRGASTGVVDAAMRQESRWAAGSASKQGGSAVAFLAWTTTPWTLPANAALAVNPKATYVTVELAKPENLEVKYLILAKSCLGELELRKSEYRVVKEEKGRTLVGLKYQPLYAAEGLNARETQTVHRVYADASVSLDDGTGVLHVAPRYGETDLELGLKEALPLLASVDSNGIMVSEPGKGRFFKEADSLIIADLTHKKRIFAAETFRHTYPFCWRCDSPLLYFATPSWFVKVTTLTDKLVKNNNQISWVPAHIKKGRFGNWLAEARDWGISRNRFWGAPLPVWVNQQDPDDWLVVGSLAQLRELSGYQGEFDLHRPGIDKVVIKKGGKTYKRVEEVFDCWFESGAMPYAQDHFPFDTPEYMMRGPQGFPADFISEGLDQTRGWFYTLHVLATGLFNKPAYKNVICHGIVVAADGKKLSKRLRNYPPLEEVFESYGADILRFFMLNSPVVAGESVRFGSELLKEVQRNVFMTWWNVFSFFKTYADIDKWQAATLEEPILDLPKTSQLPQSSRGDEPVILSDKGVAFSYAKEQKKLLDRSSGDVGIVGKSSKSSHILDQWILARLNQTTAEVTKQADAYRLDRATQPLVSFIEDLSNWYVRRSRRRFWKSEDDQDKQQAYATLHYVLVRTAQLFAPWSPFLSDYIYRQLTGDMAGLPPSVHLTDWPTADAVDGAVIDTMSKVRAVINEALSQRAAAGIKVRQPLGSVRVPKMSAAYQVIVAEEVNVKAVQQGEMDDKVVLDTTLTDELKREGLMREVVRQVQSARKAAGLNVNDRIGLVLLTDSLELKKAIHDHSSTIKQETLAVHLKAEGSGSYETIVKIEAHDLTITFAKSS